MSKVWELYCKIEPGKEVGEAQQQVRLEDYR